MAKVLDETLRAAGFRLTAPRRAVIGLLQRSGGQHLSAEDIHAALGRRGLRVDLVSVYRTLNLLVRLGVVHEASLRQTHAHYEIEHGAEVHLACVACGKVTEARLPTRGRAAEYLARVARRRGFRLTRFGIEVEGYCAPCSALRNGRRRVKSGRTAR